MQAGILYFFSFIDIVFIPHAFDFPVSSIKPATLKFLKRDSACFVDSINNPDIFAYQILCHKFVVSVDAKLLQACAKSLHISEYFEKTGKSAEAVILWFLQISPDTRFASEISRIR